MLLKCKGMQDLLLILEGLHFSLNWYVVNLLWQSATALVYSIAKEPQLFALHKVTPPLIFL